MTWTSSWDRSRAWWLVIAGLALGAAPPVGAHHSYAAFDAKYRITVTGRVAAFAWTNPHAIIDIDGAEENGGIRRWTMELASPSVLQRAGWKSSDVKFGDRVIVVVNPLKSGEAGGLLVEATLADGRVLGNGTPPVDPR